LCHFLLKYRKIWCFRKISDYVISARVLTKRFPVDQCVQTWQKTVELVNLFEEFFEIEKRKLPGFAHHRAVKTGEKAENATVINNLTPDEKMSRTTQKGQ